MRARVLLAVVAALLLPASAAHAESAYSIVHGCYALQAPDGKLVVRDGSGGWALASRGEPLRMQATTLAQYLFYASKGDFVSTSGSRDRKSVV